jgi:hypothetical protein
MRLERGDQGVARCTAFSIRQRRVENNRDIPAGVGAGLSFADARAEQQREENLRALAELAD